MPQATLPAPPAPPAPPPQPPPFSPAPPGDPPLAASFSPAVWLALAPGWLVSLTVHLFALLALAVISLDGSSPGEGDILVVAAVAEPDAPLVVEAPLELKLPPAPLETPPLMPLRVVDPGAEALAASLAETAALDGASLEAALARQIDSVADLGGKGLSQVSAASGGAEFFGIKASGAKFAFIVDSSRSMADGKFQAACEELLAAIRRLNKSQHFYVMFFDRDCARMALSGLGPEPRCVPATPDNLRKLQRWMETIVLELKTDPLDSVRFALEELQPDAIYLLSDGRFTDGGATMRYLRNNNILDDELEGPRPKAVIHTIGFYQREGEPTLKAIADDHGGTYRFVPRPGAKGKRQAP